MEKQDVHREKTRPRKVKHLTVKKASAEVRTGQVLWISGAFVTVAIILIALLFLRGNPLNISLGGTKYSFFFDDLAVLALILGLIGPSLHYIRDSKRKTAMDNNMPLLLTDIAEAGSIGMTLTRAIEVSADRSYGPLTKELKRLVAQMTWKVPLEKALASFAERCGTELSKKVAFLIREAYKTGGEIQESIDTLNLHLREIQNQDRQRKSQMRPYVGVIYISFFVFLLTIFILSTQFFGTNTAGFSSFSGLVKGGAAVSKEQIQAVFYYMAVIQAIFSGLAGGKMSTGTIKGGLIHIIVLTFMSFAAFNFLV